MALNKIPAHISLFHALPGAERDAVAAALAEVCGETPGFDLWPEGPVSLGRGVAFRYHQRR